MRTFAVMKIHAPLFPLALCLIAGIVLSDYLHDGLAALIGYPTWTAGLAALGIAVVATALLYRWPRWQTAGIWLCCLLFGLTLGTRQRQALDVTWPKERMEREVVVVSEPVVKARWVVLDVLTATGHHKLKLRILRDADSEKIAIGHGLLISTAIRPIHEWQSGHFSYRRHLQCQGFTGEAFVHGDQWQWQEVSLEGFSIGERLRLRFLLWRHRLLETYRQWEMSADSYSVVAAMTLGDKSALDPRVKDIYAKVGASHILALSGMHLMIIYSIVTLLFGWRRARLLSQVIIVAAIWGFAVLTGLSPSVTRSASMISVFALLSVGYRGHASVNVLAFIAIVMLLIHPLALYDIGFQLSFMAVLAIALWNPWLNSLIPLHVQQRHRWLSKLWALTTVSIAAQIGTAPLVAYYFGRFATWFLLSNYIVVPMATLLLHLSLLLIVVSGWQMIAVGVAQVLKGCVELMQRLLEAVATLPYCSIDGLYPSAVQVLLIYICIGGCFVALSLRFPATRRSV